MRHDEAVSTMEIAFRRATGEQRGAFNGILDANIFEHGDTQSIGILLKETANKFNQAIKHITFEPEESENGRPKALLQHGIEQLQEIGKTMETMPDKELDNYDWRIIANLLVIIAGLLDHYNLR
jgi:hypothetical protein